MNLSRGWFLLLLFAPPESVTVLMEAEAMDLLIIPSGSDKCGPIEAAMMHYKVPFGLRHQFPWSQLCVHEP